MKPIFGILSCALALASPVAAIPNQITNPVFNADSPLNGEDLTGEVLGAVENGEALPGEWVPEGRIGTAEISHLLARPKLFGREVVLLRAIRREGELERVEATFADAGSYFGYFDEELPEDLSRRERREVLRQRLAERQASFAELYENSLGGVREAVAAVADDGPDDERVGDTRTLRAEVEEWRLGEVVMRLFSAEERLVRLVVSHEDAVNDSWMDRAYLEEDDRERAARLASAVERSEDGVVRITGLDPVPQGYRPYCGLNTLVMAARHFGLHLDEDWLAAAGGFRNTGSAAGSEMISLYHAVAAEADLSMNRSRDFDEWDVCDALAAGRPVIVWRRFSPERNRLHDRVAAGRAELPDPNSPEERASWPGEDAPLHASVLTGFDPEKRHVFFLESWSGRDKPRRMTFEEMAATCDVCFVFEE